MDADDDPTGLGKSRKTGAVSGAPSEGLANSLTVRRRASAPFALPITDVLDLHTFAPRDVAAAVEGYLEEAHRLGLRALRIIHGRGIGVQRETTRKALARSKFVKSFGDAPAEAGGWGATVVTLRDSRS